MKLLWKLVKSLRNVGAPAEVPPIEVQTNTHETRAEWVKRHYGPVPRGPKGHRMAHCWPSAAGVSRRRHKPPVKRATVLRVMQELRSKLSDVRREMAHQSRCINRVAA